MSEQNSTARGWRRFTPLTFADFLRLLIACTLVGMLMRFFGLTPGELWGGAAEAITTGWSDAFSAIGTALVWARDYILLGAAVVVPVWIAFKMLGGVLRRR